MGLYRRALQIIMQFQIWVPVSTDPTFVKPEAMNTHLTRWAPTLFSTTPRPGFHTALCYSLCSCSVALLATCLILWSCLPHVLFCGQVPKSMCSNVVAICCSLEEKRTLEDSNQWVCCPFTWYRACHKVWRKPSCSTSAWGLHIRTEEMLPNWPSGSNASGHRWLRKALCSYTKLIFDPWTKQDFQCSLLFTAYEGRQAVHGALAAGRAPREAHQRHILGSAKPQDPQFQISKIQPCCDVCRQQTSRCSGQDMWCKSSLIEVSLKLQRWLGWVSNLTDSLAQTC